MGRVLAFVILLIGSTCVAASAQARQPEGSLPDTAMPASVETVLEHTLTNYVRPAYRDFESVATELMRTVETLCAAPSEAALGEARQAFRAAVLRWSGVEWWRIGPVMTDNRLERIFFFPDRKGTGRKQVVAAIASRDDDVVSPRALAQMSVAMQGFGALEYLLYGKGSEALMGAGASHRCAFARAVSGNLLARSRELVRGWEEGSRMANLFVEPAPQNPLFRTGQEAMTVLLGQLVHGLEALADSRIGVFLARDDSRADRPRLAPLWRSEATLPSLVGGLEGLERLFVESGMARIAGQASPGLGKAIRFEFTQAIRTARALTARSGGIAQALANPDARARLAYLRYAIGIIVARLDREFAPAVGLAVGFSFGDGD